MNEISGNLLKLSKSPLLGNPTLPFVSPCTKGEPTDLPGMHRFRDTFMLAHNAHLLLGTCGEDEAGNKLLHIAGMRCSNGQGEVSRDIPISIPREDGVIGEAAVYDLLVAVPGILCPSSSSAWAASIRPSKTVISRGARSMPGKVIVKG